MDGSQRNASKIIQQIEKKINLKIVSHLKGFIFFAQSLQIMVYNTNTKTLKRS